MCTDQRWKLSCTVITCFISVTVAKDNLCITFFWKYQAASHFYVNALAERWSCVWNMAQLGLRYKNDLTFLCPLWCVNLPSLCFLSLLFSPCTGDFYSVLSKLLGEREDVVHVHKYNPSDIINSDLVEEIADVVQKKDPGWYISRQVLAHKERPDTILVRDRIHKFHRLESTLRPPGNNWLSLVQEAKLGGVDKQHPGGWWGNHSKMAASNASSTLANLKGSTWVTEIRGNTVNYWTHMPHNLSNLFIALYCWHHQGLCHSNVSSQKCTKTFYMDLLKLGSIFVFLCTIRIALIWVTLLWLQLYPSL